MVAVDLPLTNQAVHLSNADTAYTSWNISGTKESDMFILESTEKSTTEGDELMIINSTSSFFKVTM